MTDLSAIRKLAAETLALAERATQLSEHGGKISGSALTLRDGYWWSPAHVPTLDSMDGTVRPEADVAFFRHARTGAPSLAKAVEELAGQTATLAARDKRIEALEAALSDAADFLRDHLDDVGLVARQRLQNFIAQCDALLKKAKA